MPLSVKFENYETPATAGNGNTNAQNNSVTGGRD